MRIVVYLAVISWGTVAAAFFANAAESPPNETLTTLELLGGPGSGRKEWRSQDFPFVSPTQYSFLDETTGVVLRGVSQNANRSLLYPVPVENPQVARLRWRWRVDSTLRGEPSERRRGGDDYAARVFVVFETSWLPTRTRAITYVWSAREPVDAVYANPYTDRVGMFVLRSGADQADQAWVSESRDVLSDYVRFFGRAPTRVSAVAVMVDTDNTGQSATGWFRDMFLEISPAPRASAP